jgi:hypothetical protein
MRKVVTINKKIQFDDELQEIQTSIETIKMNGLTDSVETKVIPQDEEIAGYKVFKILYYKKYNIVGMINGKTFESILRKYEIPVLVQKDKDYVLSYSTSKGIIARAALKRIRKDTVVKCAPIKIDLFKAYTYILNGIENVEVFSGWFSRLGEQLQNALLQGSAVNEDNDWNRYKNKRGVELKNIQLRFFDDKYVSGSVILSISSRGFIFTNSAIGEKDFFELIERIISVLDSYRIIEDAEEEKEEVTTIFVNDKE